MHDFRITLRVDTPVLLGSADSSQWDDCGRLRGSSVRGLLHTFARALWAPMLVNNDTGKVDASRLLEVERRLFGEAAKERSSPPTFRVRDVTPLELLRKERNDAEPYPIRPNRDFRDDKNKDRRNDYIPNSDPNYRRGIKPGSTRVLEFSPRPSALRRFQIGDKVSEPVPAFRDMLWVVVWTAFTFGSIGLRQRRGYGSLTIVDSEGTPSLDALSSQPCELPIFGLESVKTPASQAPVEPSGNPASAATLSSISAGETTRRIFCGYWVARMFAYQWLQRADAEGVRCLFEDPTLGDPVLRLGNRKQLFVGKANAKDWKARLSDQMKKCSSLTGPPQSKQRQQYERELGGLRKKNVGASPLWIRYFLTSEGLMPFCFHSCREIANEGSLVDQLLRSEALGCEPILTRIRD